MKKLRFPTLPNNKLPSRRVLLTVGAVIVLLGLFLYAISIQVRAERRMAAWDAQVAAARQKQVDDLKTQVADLKSENTTIKEQKESVCQWVRGVVPKYKVPVPPLCQTISKP